MPDAGNPVVLGEPAAAKNDANVMIYPFKKMIGTQAADTSSSTLIVPHLFPYGAEDTTAFWKFYDWSLALTEGARYNGQPTFIGPIQWVPTVMYLTVNHEVAPKEQALGINSCADCHNGGQIDWSEIGWTGDPMQGGGREP